MTKTSDSPESFKAVFVRVLNVSAADFRDDLKIGDFEQWDSIAHLELVAELEAAFGVQFATEDLLGLKSVTELRARVAELSGATT